MKSKNAPMLNLIGSLFSTSTSFLFHSLICIKLFLSVLVAKSAQIIHEIFEMEISLIFLDHSTRQHGRSHDFFRGGNTFTNFSKNSQKNIQKNLKNVQKN